MQFQKLQRILVITGLALLIIQLPWYLVVQFCVNKTETKTTATVVRIGRAAAGCTGDTAYAPDPTCDHSPRLYPVYVYYDQNGQRHEQDDRFFGEYKQNNPFRPIFGKKVGDKVTAYYTKGKPGDVIFMASPYVYAVWLLPLYLVILVFVVSGSIYLVHRYGRRRRKRP